MKTIFKLPYIFFAIGVIAVSCSKDEPANDKISETETLTIQATLADAGAGSGTDIDSDTYVDAFGISESGCTKTVLRSDGSVWWNPIDSISLFYGSGTAGGNKFTSTNTQPAAIANFNGSVGVITGGGEIPEDQTLFWGVYPYSTAASCDGTSVTLSHPAVQISAAGTFSNGQFPTMGRSQNLLMSFYNICGGIKFTVTHSDIVKVIFQARGGETLAGTLNIGFDPNSKPKVNRISGGSNKIVVTPQAGGAFVAGTTYFAVIPPVTMSQGIDVTYQTQTQEATYTNSNSITINRSMFKNLAGKDENLSFHKIRTDLSADGTANCYIVSQKGLYKFPAVRGNSSTLVGDVKGVKVLWESFGTDVTPTIGDLIKANVSYSGGYITFSTNDIYKEGNAVIAAYSDSECTEGNVLWSWHIWFTDKPVEQIYNNSAGTMMDRNLGATSVTPGEVQAFGLLYQWGRKDPFLGSSSISSYTKAKSTITWSSAVSSDATNGTIAFAVSHPTTFITYNSSNYDWYYTGSSSTDNTRWQTLDKTKGLYDPCPAGWRVPDGGNNGVWSKAFGSSSFYSDGPWNDTNKGMNFGSGNGHTSSQQLGSATTIWYPAAGYIFSLRGSLDDVGYYGHCWSCTPGGDCACFLYFNFTGDVYPSIVSLRADGRSVRCLKESK